MEKNNTGKEIKNNSRKLYDSLTKQITEINHYIWVLEYIENKRWNSNDDKARALYKRLCEKLGHSPKISALEIKRHLDRHDSLLTSVQELTKWLRELEKAKKKIKKWKDRFDRDIKLADLLSSAITNQMKEIETVDEIIEDFLDAKKSLNTVCELARKANSKNLPIVKEIINAYLDFFRKADAICMTVAKYARNINREVEKTLGAKGTSQMIFRKNSKFEMDLQRKIQEKPGKVKLNYKYYHNLSIKMATVDSSPPSLCFFPPPSNFPLFHITFPCNNKYRQNLS